MMFLPIGDLPNDPKRVAGMNYALIGMNVAVYLLALTKGFSSEGFDPAAYETFLLRWAYNPADPSLQTLFSSMFMHAGFLHLAGNMLFLWIFGDNVEARLGAFGYLVSYLCLGAVATLVFGLVSGPIDMPLIGASGAVSGVQGLYFIACPRHQVRLFIWLFIVIITVVKVNARWLMAIWFFLQDVLPVVVGTGPTGDNVAHSAHLGGFAAGLALMFLLRRLYPAIDDVEAREFQHSRRYESGRTARARYAHIRRRDPYAPRAVVALPPPRPPRPGAPPPPAPPPLRRPPPLPPSYEDLDEIDD